MKKILTILLILFMMASVSAGSFITNQNSAQSVTADSDGVNTFQETVFATDNNNISIDNLTVTYDIEQTFFLTDEMYFNYNNDVLNETLVVYVQWGSSITPTIETYTISLDEIGQYTFAFIPDNNQEQLLLRINYPDSDGAFLENFQLTRQRGLSDVVNSLTTAMTELIEINLGFWKVLYFAFLLSIFIGVIFVIITFIIKIIEFAQKFSKKKRTAHGGGR